MQTPLLLKSLLQGRKTYLHGMKLKLPPSLLPLIFTHNSLAKMSFQIVNFDTPNASPCFAAAGNSFTNFHVVLGQMEQRYNGAHGGCYGNESECYITGVVAIPVPWWRGPLTSLIS